MHAWHLCCVWLHSFGACLEHAKIQLLLMRSNHVAHSPFATKYCKHIIYISTCSVHFNCPTRATGHWKREISSVCDLYASMNGSLTGHVELRIMFQHTDMNSLHHQHLWGLMHSCVYLSIAFIQPFISSNIASHFAAALPKKIVPEEAVNKLVIVFRNTAWAIKLV